MRSMGRTASTSGRPLSGSRYAPATTPSCFSTYPRISATSSGRLSRRHSRASRPLDLALAFRGARCFLAIFSISPSRTPDAKERVSIAHGFDPLMGARGQSRQAGEDRQNEVFGGFRGCLFRSAGKNSETTRHSASPREELPSRRRDGHSPENGRGLLPAGD